MNARVPNDLTIFNEALDIASDRERAAYLDQACGGDAALRRKVELLLAAYGSGSGILEDLEREPLRSRWEGVDEPPGTAIGRYTLLEKLGEGGMGVVYMAEEEPLGRKVALKVIKWGMDTQSVIKRFEAERKALGRMDHPGIARALDGGATAAGRPYFVMELVSGSRITDHCDEAQLSVNERLELFINVCHSIQHAHQKGVIHRDIKPSNILVTLLDGKAVPKVIDFGVAKAIEGRRTDRTHLTQLGALIGTPSYMSPEQASLGSGEVDTRTDIYGLCVLLYELLTGKTPLDAGECSTLGLEELFRRIRQEEPVRPSMRLAQELNRQGTNGNKLDRRTGKQREKSIKRLRGDLDWIVMKGLEKDPGRRYATVNALIADLQRHLNNEPVTARPPSAVYRLQKAWRRNRLVSLSAASVAIALLAGSVVSLWQARAARKAKIDALAQTQEAVVARRSAEWNADRARRIAYAADMNLAKQAIDGSDFGRATDILDRHRPKSGETDLRGWEWRYLWQLCRSDALGTITQLPGIANSVGVSADGQFIAAATGRPAGVTVARINGPASPEVFADDLNVWRLAFHPERPWLAISGNTTTGALEIRLLDVTTGSRLWGIRSEEFLPAPDESQKRERPGESAVREGRGFDQCFGLGFLAGGERLLAYLSGKPTQLMIFETATGKVSNRHATQHLLETSDAKPDSFIVSPDGTRCLIATHKNGLEAVDLASGRSVWHTQLGKVFSVLACSGNGRWLAGAGEDGDHAIEIFDMVSGERIGKPLAGHDGWIAGMQFMENDQTLVSCGADQTIRVWDLTERKAAARLIGSRQELWGLRCVPGTDRFVTGGKDGKLMLWDAHAPLEGRDHVKIPRDIRAVRLLEGVQSVRTLDVTGAVEEWRAPSFHDPVQLFQFPGSPGHGSISADGGLLAVAVAGAGVELWRLSDGQQIPLSLGDTGEVFLPVFNECGDLYLIQFDHRIVRLKSGVWTPASSWQWDRSSMTGGFAPTGQWNIQTRPAQGNGVHLEMTLRHIESGSVTEHRTGPGTYSSSFCAGFSRDGRMVGVPAEPGLVLVHTVPEMKEIRRFAGHRYGAKGIGFSPDGTRVATSSLGRETLKLWDWETGLELLTLASDNRGEIQHIHFSSDGNVILLHSGNNSAYLWRAPSLEEIDDAESADH